MSFGTHQPDLWVLPTSAQQTRFTGYVWGIAMVAALGGLLFGYDWVVIDGARQFYESYFGLTSKQMIGWIAAK